MKLAALLLAASVTAADACAPMPLAPKIDPPGSLADIKHRASEAYIQARLAETSHATLALGDSIMGGWPHDLLEAKWGGPVLQGGRGGSTTLHWLRWLDVWDWSKQDPAVVHLHVGRNDVTTGACPRFIAASVLKVIAKVQARWPAARVVWQNIPPGGYELRLMAAEIREVNRLVLAAAPAGGFEVWDAWRVVWSRCVGARVCGLFLDGDRYRYGPIHFDPHAYALIARDAEMRP